MAAARAGVVDNTLHYMDQGSLLGLRALGHGPLIQFVWVYRHAVDLDGLEGFRRNLGHGLLGRRVERSPLPFGRHHWVAWSDPLDIDVAGQAIPRDQIPAWADRKAALPIDPEHGPSWRLAVQPLTDGGAAVTLVVSHTVADGVGATLAIADAARGVTRDLGYPPPGARPRWRALREDVRRFVRDVPEIGRAVAAAARLARSNKKSAERREREAASGASTVGGSVTVPSVSAHIDVAQWDRIAKSLGGTSNSLLTAFAARLGRNLGWSRDGAPAALSLPVNERFDGDTRGNALNAVTLEVDDRVVTRDLSEVRARLKAELSGLAQSSHELLAPLPLVPLTPRAAVRRLEGMVARDHLIGCSNLGDLDPFVNRPDGTDAEYMFARQFEHLSRADLGRSGGVFFPVASGRVAGNLFFDVGFSDAEAATTREQLAAVVKRTLDEFGISGTIR